MRVNGSPEVMLTVLTMQGAVRYVPVIRRHIGAVLGSGHPAREALEICVSELVTNGIRHTASGRGGHVTVALSERDGTYRLDVSDDGGSATTPRPAAQPDEGGRGLLLVQEYATEWRARTGPDGTTVTAIVSG